jgi:hypothetical protein
VYTVAVHCCDHPYRRAAYCKCVCVYIYIYIYIAAAAAATTVLRSN